MSWVSVRSDSPSCDSLVAPSHRHRQPLDTETERRCLLKGPVHWRRATGTTTVIIHTSDLPFGGCFDKCSNNIRSFKYQEMTGTLNHVDVRSRQQR